MTNNKPLKQIITLGIILSTYCIIAAIALSVTYSFTLPAIKLQEKKATEKSMRSIYPNASTFNLLKSSTGELLVNKKEISSGIVLESIFEAFSNNHELIGIIIKGSSQGYGGPINYVFGINLDKTIQMVTIIDQCETPGLGANVTCGKFLDQFQDKALSDNFVVKKDITPITASTITSKALTNGIKKTSDYITENFQELLNEK